MPYRIFPMNLTSGDTIPMTGFALDLGYENPGSGDPPDAVITALCWNTVDHPAHSVTDQVGGPDTGAVSLPLDHEQGHTGVVVRGVICSMDPFLERDSFEVSNITVLGDLPPFEIAEAKRMGEYKQPWLQVFKGQDATFTMKYIGKNQGTEIYVFVQTVGRHGVPTVWHVKAYPFKAETGIVLPSGLWDGPTRVSLRLALVNQTLIRAATTIPIHIGPW